MITSVTLVDRDSNIDAKGLRSATNVYQIETTDAVGDDEIAVLSASDLPKRLDKHPTDDTLWVSTISAKPFEDRLHWRVTVNYEPMPYGFQSGSGQKPWEMPAQVSYFLDKEQVAISKAYDYDVDKPFFPSLPIVNSAQDPFIDPLMKNKNRFGIHIIKNVEDANWDPVSIFSLIDTLNESTDGSGARIGGVAIADRQARIKEMKLDPAMTDEQELYWVFTVDIVMDRDEWAQSIYDQGFNTMNATTGEKTRIQVKDPLGGDDKDAVEPQPLDGAGQVRNPVTSPLPKYKDFAIYPLADWSILDLPKEKDGAS